MLEKAKEAQKKAYSPYSGFKIGAAVLTEKDHKIFTGCNVENISYGASICGERVAMLKAVSEGYTSFLAILTIGSDCDEPIPSCGLCRQLMQEFACGPDMKVIACASNGKYEICDIKDYLPGVSYGIAKNGI